MQTFLPQICKHQICVIFYPLILCTFRICQATKISPPHIAQTQICRCWICVKSTCMSICVNTILVRHRLWLPGVSCILIIIVNFQMRIAFRAGCHKGVLPDQTRAVKVKSNIFKAHKHVHQENVLKTRRLITHPWQHFEDVPTYCQTLLLCCRQVVCKTSSLTRSFP
jgi:hypothetical protein